MKNSMSALICKRQNHSIRNDCFHITKTSRDVRRLLAIVLILTWSVAGIFGEAAADPTNGPSKVEIRKTGDSFQLYVNHQPFYIKGAGMDYGDTQRLAAHGGNSFRTWSTHNAEQVLDNAEKNGLYVTLGLDVGRERQGFDYNDPAAVARQLESLKKVVLRYKDHPALIIWAIGNELNLNATNPKVWDAVNDISKMIHQVDPNHLTTTPLAGFNKNLVAEIKKRAPDLDLLSFQMYADIVNLPHYLQETDWHGPYMITEWGATGHWEVGKTDWGAPIEDDSTTKANLYEQRFETAIANQKGCLGSYVFLWGQKQERTPTWYGMFLNSGEATASVDVLQHLWTGEWPAIRSPSIASALLDGKNAHQNIRLKPDQTYTADIQADSKGADALTYSWQVMEESAETKTGGDRESVPAVLSGLISDSKAQEVKVRAPSKPGAYRLFVYAFDGKGHAAHANIPFYVSQ
jgi:hypothetical protein